jgi:transcriptional regulator with XRE-family HTH domain
MVGESKKILRAFGARLRKCRLAAGLSQEDLSGKCGLDRTYIGGVERGERNLSLLNIIKIATALRIPASMLMEAEDE